ncbi:MAG: hypothetical protein PVF90_09890 [Gemmatimonadota bacterium]|jgi:hypothetical protein
MFCNKPLGENEVVEHFPVGRRLAFDPDKGRLWVVCRKCERWNLSPIEERWEAIETCDRIYMSTRVRASTENIGLAKHPEGLELVRIGRPMRPEFAAWRYGDQFGRRRNRAILVGAGVTAVVGALVVGGVAAGGGMGLIGQIPNFIANRTLVKVRTEDGVKYKLNQQDLKQVRLLPEDDDVGYRIVIGKRRKTKHTYSGEEARRIASVVLPKINRRGGNQRVVEGAVSEIAHSGHPDAFLRGLVDGRSFTSRKGIPGYVNKMPKPTQLALEMALHEEQERRALEGELWRLEQAWKSAEEIAGISDDLLLPEGANHFIEKNRPI